MPQLLAVTYGVASTRQRNAGLVVVAACTAAFACLRARVEADERAPEPREHLLARRAPFVSDLRTETARPHPLPRQTSPADDRPADTVVVLSIDGLRPDAIDHRTPNLAEIRRVGVYADNAHTIRNSSTLPSHASMVSGVDIDQHGIDFNAYRPERGTIRATTMFRVARRAGLSTAMFVAKNKLQHLVEPDGAERFVVGGLHCSLVAKHAVDYLATSKPGIVFIHFSEPDHAGHRIGWMTPTYLEAVRRADSCTKTIVEALRARPDANRTLLIVTSDHGGHNRMHGTLLDVDRHIPWMLLGAAGVPRLKIHREVSTLDTAATALYALGLKAPDGMVGTPVSEAFAPTAGASNAKNYAPPEENECRRPGPTLW